MNTGSRIVSLWIRMIKHYFIMIIISGKLSPIKRENLASAARKLITRNMTQELIWNHIKVGNNLPIEN